MKAYPESEHPLSNLVLELPTMQAATILSAASESSHAKLLTGEEPHPFDERIVETVAGDAEGGESLVVDPDQLDYLSYNLGRFVLNTAVACREIKTASSAPVFSDLADRRLLEATYAGDLVAVLEAAQRQHMFYLF